MCCSTRCTCCGVARPSASVRVSAGSTHPELRESGHSFNGSEMRIDMTPRDTRGALAVAEKCSTDGFFDLSPVERAVWEDRSAAQPSLSTCEESACERLKSKPFCTEASSESTASGSSLSACASRDRVTAASRSRAASSHRATVARCT